MRTPSGGAGRLLQWAIVAAVALGATGSWRAAPAAAATGGAAFTFEPVPAPNTQAPRSSFRYSLKPGGTLTDSVLLTNLTDQPEEFEIWAADAYNTPRSGYLALRPATYPKTGVGRWITLPVSAGVHVLPAATSATLTFELAVPPNATPGDHVGGIVALDVTPQPVTGGKTQFLVHQGIASAVFVHVIGPLHPSAAVVAVDVAQSEPPLGFAPGTSHAFVAYKLENTGNTLLDGTATVRVTDVFGRTVKTFKPTPVAEFLPGQTFTVVEPKWQPLPFVGPEHVTVVFRPTGAAIASGATTFWIVPWLLLVLVLAALAGWAWRIRRRRQRGRAGPGGGGDSVPPAPEREPVTAST
jgi:hypothetical protein